MKYGHAVKRNGVLYMAGEEVPVGNSSTLPVTPPEQKMIKGFLDVEDLKAYEPDELKDLATKLGVKFTDETTHEELAELCSKVEVDIPQTEDSKVEYKKSDIQRMAVDDLRALATKIGIEDAAETTGAKLKEEIIAKLGL